MVRYRYRLLFKKEDPFIYNGEKIFWGSSIDDKEGIISIEDYVFCPNRIVTAECAQSYRGFKNSLTGREFEPCLHKGIFARLIGQPYSKSFFLLNFI